MRNPAGSEEELEITPDLIQAIERTLFHHPYVTPAVFTMIIRKEIDGNLPEPTDEEREQASGIVENMVKHYKESFKAAVRDVLGEDCDEW